MTPQLFDHLVVAVIVLVVPLYAIRFFKVLQRAVAAGRPGARVHAYRRALGSQWITTLALLTFWTIEGRTRRALGFGPIEGTRAWLGVGVCALVIALLLAQLRAVYSSEDARRSILRQTAKLEALLPHDAVEGRWFSALSITAGICEETLYRGFLIAYLHVYVGTAAAWAISSLVFGVGHSYQGLGGVGKTGVVGGVLGGLYLFTGTLWVPIALHATQDLVAGAASRRALSETSEAAA
jgi:membrane protease YdiL (CAAX protease family)